MFIVGVAGGSGSGKTTFASKIVTNAGQEDISILHMDAYYLPIQPASHYTSKGKPNYDHPEAFDWELLAAHLQILKNGQSIQCPVYDFATSSRKNDETLAIGPCKVLIFEGIFALFSEEIRELLDVKCFLHVDADIRFTRRLHRDVQERGRSLESVIEQYYDTVRPMYQKYLDPQKQYADIVIGEETDNAATILSARVKEVLNSFLPSSKKTMEQDTSFEQFPL